MSTYNNIVSSESESPASRLYRCTFFSSSDRRHQHMAQLIDSESALIQTHPAHRTEYLLMVVSRGREECKDREQTHWLKAYTVRPFPFSCHAPYQLVRVHFINMPMIRTFPSVSYQCPADFSFGNASRLPLELDFNASECYCQQYFTHSLSYCCSVCTVSHAEGLLFLCEPQ